MTTVGAMLQQVLFRWPASGVTGILLSAESGSHRGLCRSLTANPSPFATETRLSMMAFAAVPPGPLVEPRTGTETTQYPRLPVEL